MGCSQSSSKREVYSSRILPQETRKVSNRKPNFQFSSAQFSHSVVSDSLRLHESQHARPPCPSPTPSSLRLTSIESVMPSSHLILCHPLLLLPPIPLSIRVFSNESPLRMRWSKSWSFSFSIIPSKEIPGLISFRMAFANRCAIFNLIHNHSDDIKSLSLENLFLL